MNAGLDITGTLRRARRRADLSQRELAARIGVSASCVARAETGGRVRVDLLERALAAAGLRLLVVDADDEPVKPMRDDGVRDGARRRFPAHLDPFGLWGVGVRYRSDRPYPRPPGSATFVRRHAAWPRPWPDRPDDHPSRQDLLPVRRPARPVPPVPGEDCACGPECERRCVPDCGCQCEPEKRRVSVREGTADHDETPAGSGQRLRSRSTGTPPGGL